MHIVCVYAHGSRTYNRRYNKIIILFLLLRIAFDLCFSLNDSRAANTHTHTRARADCCADKLDEIKFLRGKK